MASTCRLFREIASSEKFLWRRLARKLFQGNLSFDKTWKRSVLEACRRYIKQSELSLSRSRGCLLLPLCVSLLCMCVSGFRGRKRGRGGAMDRVVMSGVERERAKVGECTDPGVSPKSEILMSCNNECKSSKRPERLNSYANHLWDNAKRYCGVLPPDMYSSSTVPALFGWTSYFERRVQSWILTTCELWGLSPFPPSLPSSLPPALVPYMSRSAYSYEESLLHPSLTCSNSLTNHALSSYNNCSSQLGLPQVHSLRDVLEGHLHPLVVPRIDASVCCSPLHSGNFDLLVE